MCRRRAKGRHRLHGYGPLRTGAFIMAYIQVMNLSNPTTDLPLAEPQGDAGAVTPAATPVPTIARPRTEAEQAEAAVAAAEVRRWDHWDTIRRGTESFPRFRLPMRRRSLRSNTDACITVLPSVLDLTNNGSRASFGSRSIFF